MSRTYRKAELNGNYAHGKFWTWEEQRNLSCEETLGWNYCSKFVKNARDKKPWNKPDKSFKQMHRQAERAKVKDAMAKGKEIPRFRHYDQWEWT